MSAQERSKALLDAALRYGNRGFPVFPLHHITPLGGCSCGDSDCRNPGKHPRTAHGLKDASVDETVIRQFWQCFPLANIGIRTGGKLDVLDIDLRHGGYESLAAFEEKHGKLPKTVTAKTGGGGLHFGFDPMGRSLRNRNGLLPGVDFKADNGYIVAPPSNHKSGRCYEWDVTFGLEQVPIADIPPALLDLVTAKTDKSSVVQGDFEEVFREGERNSGLTSIAGRLVKAGLKRNFVSAALSAINANGGCEPPLQESEIKSIAASVSRYGLGPVEWTAPRDLPALEPIVPELDKSMLPAAIGDWAWDISDRMQCPPEFAVIPVLVVLSSLVGGRTLMHPKKHDPWTEAPNLWGMVVAPPGSMKSPCFSEALKPIHKLQNEAMLKFKSEMRKFNADEGVLKTRLETLKKSAKGEAHEQALKQTQEEMDLLSSKKPVASRYVANDATTEKLGEILSENNTGILVYRDELFGFLMNLEKKGREGDRSLFLESWGGQNPYTFDRIGRGTVHIPKLCISILGGIQPDRLFQYFDQSIVRGTGDDGLLARFQLTVWPRVPSEFKLIDRAPNAVLGERLELIFRDIINWDHAKEEFSADSPQFYFEDEAQQIFNFWYESLQKRLRSGTNGSMAFQAHLSKYGSLMPCLALIFHVVESFTGTTSESDVTLRSAERAINWCNYLELHARKIYASTISPELNAAHALAKRILSFEVYDGMPVRDIYRKQWSSLTSVDLVRLGLKLLESYGWIQITEMPSGIQGGAPSEVLRINPAVKSLFSKQR